MKLLIILIAILFSPSFGLCEDICPLKGKWKSNKEATLVEMKNADLTEKQVQLFSGDLFGKMIVEASCGELTYTFDGYVNKEFYKVLEHGETYILVESREVDSNNTQITRIELKGDCYLVPITGVGFSEVFCKIKK